MSVHLLGKTDVWRWCFTAIASRRTSGGVSGNRGPRCTERVHIRDPRRFRSDQLVEPGKGESRLNRDANFLAVNKTDHFFLLKWTKKFCVNHGWNISALSTYSSSNCSTHPSGKGLVSGLASISSKKIAVEDTPRRRARL